MDENCRRGRSLKTAPGLFLEKQSFPGNPQHILIVRKFVKFRFIRYLHSLNKLLCSILISQFNILFMPGSDIGTTILLNAKLNKDFPCPSTTCKHFFLFAIT